MLDLGWGSKWMRGKSNGSSSRGGGPESREALFHKKGLWRQVQGRQDKPQSNVFRSVMWKVLVCEFLKGGLESIRKSHEEHNSSEDK